MKNIPVRLNFQLCRLSGTTEFWRPYTRQNFWIYSFVSSNGPLFLSSSKLVTTHWTNTRYFWHSHKKVWGRQNCRCLSLRWSILDSSSAQGTAIECITFDSSEDTVLKIVARGTILSRLWKICNLVSRKLHNTQLLQMPKHETVLFFRKLKTRFWVWDLGWNLPNWTWPKSDYKHGRAYVWLPLKWPSPQANTDNNHNKRKNNPYTGLDRPFGHQEVEAQRISQHSAHEGTKVVSPMHRPPLPPRWHPCYSSLLEAGSTPRP